MTHKPDKGQRLLGFYAVPERPSPPAPASLKGKDRMRDLPRDPTDTQLEAHKRARPQAPSIRKRVLDYIRSRGIEGATDEEIQQGLGLRAQSEGPRRIELMRAGLVVDSGRRRVTTSGRAAIVWRAVVSLGGGHV